MQKNKTTKGSCLCGAVTFTVPEMDRKLIACHCDMCRKWTGGPFLSVKCGTDIQFTGKEHITVYNSSDWAERGFCSKCGSGLFYRFKENKLYYMAVGLFDNCEGIIFEEQLFIDQKPEYYHFANETKNMTKEEVFAEFTPEEFQR